jgi:predicted nucleic acid-binding protein
MIFADLQGGDSVFVDANTLVYHFSAHATFGPACTQLLQRIENRELADFTSTAVLDEAMHRLMTTTEASSRFGWSFTGIGNRLRTNPAEVQKLHVFRQAVTDVLQSQIQVLTIPPGMLLAAAVLCQQIGLLTNDGLIVAIMQANGLTKLASNDADFYRVPGITRSGPV